MMRMTILLSALALIGGCTAEDEMYGSAGQNRVVQAPADRPEVLPRLAAEPQVPPFRREDPKRDIPATTNLAEINEMAGRLTDIDVFVAWLKTNTNVSDVHHHRLTWMTSNPPQQKVYFTLDGVRHNLVLTADVEVSVRTLESLQDNAGR